MSNTIRTIKELIEASRAVKAALIDDAAFLARVEEAVALVTDALAAGNRLYACGNGGSAADAQHIAAELSGRFYIERKPLPAEALHVNTSFLTAVANDYSYEEAYERAVRAFGRPGDVLLALSTSGTSKNVVRAAEEAKRIGMKVISLTGATGGTLALMSDVLLNVPSKETPRIQESHIMLGHIICELVEARLFPSAR